MEDHDPFMEKLRGEASALRWEPDEATVRRVAARIRVRTEPGVFEALSRWFVPVAAAFLVAIAASIVASLVLLGSTSTDLVAALEAPQTVQEDYYRVVD